MSDQMDNKAENAELAASFVAETRELLDEANSALLALERKPEDQEAINNLFRCVHSIKGAAGLFDLPALIHLVHAGEDLLGAMRDGKLRMDGAATDELLAGLDHVNGWLDQFHRDGKLAPDTMGIARQFAALYRARLGGERAAAQASGDIAYDAWPAWAEPAREAITAAAMGVDALVLLRYTPEEGCFFSGDDPLFTVLQTPQMAWLDIQPREPWPDPSRFDPYACNLMFLIASAATRAEVEMHYRYVPDCIELVEVALQTLPRDTVPEQASASGPSAPTKRKLTALAVELLEAQRRALSMPGRHGQVDDIAVTLRNLCSSQGLPSPLVDQGATSQDVAQAIDALLKPDAPAGPPDEDSAAQFAPVPRAADLAVERVEPSTDKTLRVEQVKVDTLMNLVGELVVAKNALPFLARDAEMKFGCRELAREIKDKYAVIDRIARQMQNSVMDIRMMPVSDLFRRFPRLVRDVARKLDKKVQLVIEGEATEADKNIIEALAEPLTHVLRNSLDHGIELPAERARLGKDETATLRLRAFQEGDSVVIEVSDDGRGIDAGRVRAKAVERGLLDAERAGGLTDDQAVQLVFLPGFSTAEQVSDLSGRGVGMDAVRTVVERHGGNVLLSSYAGEGTKVVLKLPLSMAITRVLTIELAGQLYGVPMDLVVETVRIGSHSIRRMKEAEAVVLRDTVIPIVRLRKILGMDPGDKALESILILKIGNSTVGLIIDDFGTGMDIILKPFAGILMHMGGFAGTAVLGDGRVLLVLNLKELL
ncbi:chemotaxis protein CheA [Novosphingobium sp. FSY-8]|uniref:histidine kinase n=1 Tax=Novosphingobium ovatum TaxID=1908523 RepID=A0ABW9XG08_9SPHN|nr:chemotaxis protein CheA [Novosphingobium ovatum]NBC37418.1 chemotaxis protein CheA [Novosphingobium ovatum]